MKIAVDKNQTIGSHEKSNADLHRQFGLIGNELVILNLPFGDYCEVTEQMQDTINRRGTKLKKADLVGDIKLSVDRKNSIDELCGNICGKSHNRFRDEVILAQKCGCKLYVLVENKGGEIGHTGILNPTITELSQLHTWKNPRLFIRYAGKQKYPMATKGITLQKACYTMQEKYGVTFLFCKPEDSGRKIVELLTEHKNGE